MDVEVDLTFGSSPLVMYHIQFLILFVVGTHIKTLLRGFILCGVTWVSLVCLTEHIHSQVRIHIVLY